MKSKVRCPDCSRKFSNHLVKFPIFFDNNDETMVYMICPLCALERRNKTNGLAAETPFSKKHSRNLYDEAIKENKGRKKGEPVAGKNINWEKLTRLTDEEYEKVLKRHPELLDKKD